MERLKKDNLNYLIITIAFIFNIIVFAPIEIFYTNRKEFWFSITDILPIICLFSFAFLLIFLIIYLVFKDKLLNNVKNVLFSIFFGLYLQGNFLNFGYNVLDGSTIKWETMIVKGIINTVIWLIILIVPFIFKKLKKEKLFNLISSLNAMLVIGIQLITIVTLAIGNSKTQEKEMRYGLNNSNIFKLSKEDNIIIMMADTFEATYMNKILEENPEYKEKLKDFVYFDNCTTTCFYTFSSMPIMLTGEELKLGISLKEGLQDCFDRTNIYSTLEENGYSKELYVEKMLTASNSQADNLDAELSKINTKFTTKAEIGKNMYKYVLFRYLPHFLKSSFILI